MSEYQWLMKTKVGPLYLVASEKGLKSLLWAKQAIPLTKSLKEGGPQMRILATAVAQLEEYFLGKRKTFDLHLDIAGTEFQKRVWLELSKIPYGKTCSYKEVAYRIKNDRAIRAVGTANGRNPVCIIVPCHRVIAADGSLGGYTGRIEIKSRLLALEQGTI